MVDATGGCDLYTISASVHSMPIPLPTSSEKSISVVTGIEYLARSMAQAPMYSKNGPENGEKIEAASKTRKR